MDCNKINPQTIKEELGGLVDKKINIEHAEILKRLLLQIKKVDFKHVVGFVDEEKKLAPKHFIIECIEELKRVSKQNNWSVCQRDNSTFVFNGEFWKSVAENELKKFLGEAAQQMGVDKYDAMYYEFREQLYKQFLATAYFSIEDPVKDEVLINLKNGTFAISIKEQRSREFRKEDFLTYQLPFKFNSQSQAPFFKKYLNEVLPDTNLQNILAEFIAYLFINSKQLKLEKALLLLGNGANGKSVFFEIITALLGQENITNYSLQDLTDVKGYHRAMIANKLVNYSSEINGRLEASIFKQLVSGEAVSARAPYGKPFNMTNYAKMIFNCNELPKDSEQTNAYFRRLIIIPFDVTIPESEQDKNLASKIIESELSGIFNWVLEGLNRLITQKKFTQSDIVDKQLETYQLQSDSVRLFFSENNYQKSSEKQESLKELFLCYKNFCSENLYHPCSNKTFSERLRRLGYILERRNKGMVVFVEKDIEL